jgi:hypothetical protein
MLTLPSVSPTGIGHTCVACLQHLQFPLLLFPFLCAQFLAAQTRFFGQCSSAVTGVAAFPMDVPPVSVVYPAEAAAIAVSAVPAGGGGVGAGAKGKVPVASLESEATGAGGALHVSGGVGC